MDVDAAMLPEPASKRRRVSTLNSTTSTPRYSSPDELATDLKKSSPRRSLADKVDRHLRLSSEHPPPPPPPRDNVRPNYLPKMSLTGHRGPVSQVRISPDGRWLASASADATVKIWDAHTGQLMDTLVGHMAGVSCLAWSPDGDTLATGSDDKAIRLWDRVTGRPKVSAKGISGAKDGAARPMPPMRGHHNYVVSLAFSPKGNVLASGSHDEAVFLWDVRAGRLMRSLPAHSDPVSGIGFSHDGTLVVSCSTDGLIRIWDTYTGQCLSTLVHEDNPAVTAVCFAPNSRFVLAFNLDNCIRLWDYVAGTVRKTYQGHKNAGFAVGGCFGLLPLAGGASQQDQQEGAFVASASEDGDVVLWDVSSKEIVQRIHAHPGLVCFWVDVRGDTMVTAGQDGSLRVFTHVSEVAAAANVGEAAAAVLTNGDANGHVENGVTPLPAVEASRSAEPPIKMEDEDVAMDGTGA
ncbi:hypothetical protein ACHAQA_004103 [Verticillium albo-atrum]